MLHGPHQHDLQCEASQMKSKSKTRRRLTRVKTGGAGSFATGAGGRAGQLERQCRRVWCRAAWQTSR